MWRGREDRIEQNDSSESCTPAVCIMYNACTRVCNKQQGGVVRSPTGSPWSSAPRQANTVVSNIDFFFVPIFGILQFLLHQHSVFLSVSLYLDEHTGAFIHLKKLEVEDHE